MRRNYLKTLPAAKFAVVATLFLAGSTACTEDPGATGPLAAPRARASQVGLSAVPTDEILDVVGGRIAAWAAKDPAAYASAFSTDLRFINPTGALVFGRDAFRAAHVFLFNGPFAGSTLTIAVRDIQFLTGTVALVYLDLSITGYAFLPPGVPSPSDGVARARVTWVVEKRGGEWQIVFMQNTSQL
jgi:uncharacterized protein (TIGR02246 family)